MIRKAAALIIKDKKLLIVKPKDKPYYINPGGKYEQGETAEQCLKRELLEELQINFISFKYYKTYNFEKAAHADVPLVLELYFVDIVGNIAPFSEIEKVDWLSREDFETKKFNLAPSFQTYIPDLIKERII